MSNPFAKTRPQHQPYAIYRAGDFIWHICKAYSKNPRKPYARFFVWASSPYTYGRMEGGDTYVEDILNTGRLVAAEPEFLEVFGPYSWRGKAMSPEDYIKQHATLEVN